MSASIIDPFYFTDTYAATWVATVAITSVPGLSQDPTCFGDYLTVRCIIRP